MQEALIEQQIPQPDDVTWVTVEGDAALEEVCARLAIAGSIGVDTEFVRTRTYFPKLGLIQVSDRENVYLIDPLALSDMGPFKEILLNENVCKVFHSATEDLEVLAYLCGRVPGPVFDTQMAAALSGLSLQEGYQGIVETMFGVSLSKGQTRSNWTKRPLTEEQVLYAALDVAYLLPLRDVLVSRLASRDRLHWASEESRRMASQVEESLEPENYYLGQGCSKVMDSRDLAVFQALLAWRERRAMIRDVPRGFILEDKIIRAIAKARPESMRQLARVEGLSPSQVRRHGKAMLKLLRQAEELPPEELPECGPRVSSRKVGRLVSVLKEVAAKRARELELSPEVLARRKGLTDLARNYLAGLDDPLPEEFSGWRRKAVGDELVKTLRSKKI